jgi:hypothetical protein
MPGLIASTTPTRHPVYYFSNASHVFQVSFLIDILNYLRSLGAPQIDNVLYRLCGSVLSSNSETFNSMFAATESAGLEEIDGKSDERPIHLAGTTREMFELFLEHTFGR